MRAVVIGGSMSGLLSALLLRRAGWDVDVYERVDSELSGRGAGIVAQQELIGRLRNIGLATDDLGVHITTRKILDAQGRLTHQYECPQVLTAWERVYRLLRDAFPREHYHRGHGLAGFEQDENKVVARFSNGKKISADMLVGADGIRSTVRQQCLPHVLPQYAGYSAWRALIAESAFPPAVHRELFEYMSFGLPPGEQFLGYPVAGPDNDLRPGHRRFNVVWYRPAEEKTKLQWLLTDESGVTHAISIPPPLIRRDAIVEMRADAERLLAPQFREIVRLIAEPILQPIYDLESPQMAFGRVAIVGDAAFVARPHVAAGVSKAADDAAALVEGLRAEGDVAAGLRRFAAARLDENYRIIERARHLGAYLQATRTEAEQARAGRHATDDAVLSETAVLDFLYE
ncbi:MAG TPA: FAD binding domain-containing protein [Pseudolabrys sp.]|uniref:FAD binding domain-containing protein n=1 Tax=Pseudolabrys sp. TaxID=1960880 RepID=UPI002DDCF402|nr:FAD binding domain-containing protein [Pseudolabrys sp.]HEV2631270.1 FAD binding domain-containing protein [Pseudolabrys sp.]